MRRPYYLLGVLYLLIVTNIHAQETFEHPVDYNNFIVVEMNLVVMRNLEYISQSVHTENFSEIERKRKKVIKQIKEAHKKVQMQVAFKGGERLKTESLAVLELYLKVFEVELAEANILKQTSKESYEAMENYFKAQDLAEKNLGKAGDRFAKAQKLYAKKHKLDMTAETDSDAMDNQLKRISDVNEYTRKLFLAYFKVSKHSATFLDAVNEQNKTNIEGKRKRLVAAASTTLEMLRQMDGFSGDRDYLEKTIALVTFYETIGQKGFADIARVIKAKQEDLTQADIDAYNAAINEHNQKSMQLINDFNNAQLQLLQRNVPKYKVSKRKVRRM